MIWLNEAQFYLAPDQLGQQVAAGLRTLLRDPARAPVLVLATLWPDLFCLLVALGIVWGTGALGEGIPPGHPTISDGLPHGPGS